MLFVGAQAIPNQTFQATLNNQNVTLNIYQTPWALCMDVLVNGSAIISGVICENLNRIVRDAYLGFQGDFIWYDTQDTTDPYYSGIGSRFQLVYLTPADLTALGLTG